MSGAYVLAWVCLFKIMLHFITLFCVFGITLGVLIIFNCMVVGCVPAVLGAYFRTKIPETPRFTAHVMGDTQQAKSDMAKVLKTPGEEEQQTTNETARYIVLTICF